jgi:RNA polymerase sigma-70 factor (ECF subfamily)
MEAVRAGALSGAEGDVASGEVPSFQEIFKTYSAFVWRVLLRLGVAEADVEDVAQEVFVGVHRNLPRFEGRCSLRTWVYGICHRRAVDYRRRAHTRHEIATDEPPDAGTDASQEDGIDLKSARAQLAQMLDSLDDDKRAVFVLFEIEQVPMEEVAEIVGCPLQTAYSRLYAARRKIDAAATRLRAQRRAP